MATIRAYTTIEQSRKLAEILPLESADMHYYNGRLAVDYYKNDQEYYDKTLDKYIPAWSLAALLGVLPKEIVHNKNIVFLEFHVWENSFEYVNNADYTLYVTESYDNPIDACVEMILKLHELNLL